MKFSIKVACRVRYGKKKHFIKIVTILVTVLLKMKWKWKFNYSVVWDFGTKLVKFIEKYGLTKFV